MVFVVSVNFLRVLQIGESLSPHFFVLLPLVLAGWAGCRARFFTLAPTLRFCVNLLADLEGDQPLHVRGVHQRSRQITMPRAARAKMRNSLSAELQGFVVASLAPDHAPVRGVNVSQRVVIV